MATVNAVAVQQGPVIVRQPPQANLKVGCIRGLGITQIVVGVLSIGFGIGAIIGNRYWVDGSGWGVWFGVWIIVTGIIGVLSARRPYSRCFNGTHMGFSIVCTVISFLGFVPFAFGLAYYKDCRTWRFGWYDNPYGKGFYHDWTEACSYKKVGLAMYSLLLILMIAEFTVSLVASVYCCLGTYGCCQNGCCANQSTGMTVQQQQPGYQVVTSANGQAFIATNVAYPVSSNPAGYPATSIQYAGGQTQFIQQPHASQGQVFIPLQMVTTQPLMEGQTNQGFIPQQMAMAQPSTAPQTSQGGFPQQMTMAQAPLAAQTNIIYSADQMQMLEKGVPPPYNAAS